MDAFRDIVRAKPSRIIIIGSRRSEGPAGILHGNRLNECGWGWGWGKWKGSIAARVAGAMR